MERLLISDPHRIDVPIATFRRMYTHVRMSLHKHIQLCVPPKHTQLSLMCGHNMLAVVCISALSLLVLILCKCHIIIIILESF